MACELKDIELGKVYLQNIGKNNIPNLVTIYELEKPIFAAREGLEEIIYDLNNYKNSSHAIEGLFVLCISYFESMLSELLMRYLRFFPEKILRSDRKISDRDLLSGSILELQINKVVSSMIYSPLIDFINRFCNIFLFENNFFESDLDTLIEIKESRNLLLHNRLKVNSQYLNKTRSIKRNNKINTKLEIDLPYAINSGNLLLKIVESIHKNIYINYGKYTRLNLLKELWDYTFSDSGLPIKLEDFWYINIERDILDGPWKESKIDLSHSQQIFMELWRAQRFLGSSMSSLPFCRLDEDSTEKYIFLISVFANLKMPVW